jgi:hypothetical protein
MADRPAPPARSPRHDFTQLPWRALGLGTSTIGGTTAIYCSYPLVGAAIVGCAIVVAVIVIVTALFGSPTTSGRAFRLLHWLANRSEPDAPPPEITPAAKPSRRRHGKHH